MQRSKICLTVLLSRSFILCRYTYVTLIDRPIRASYSKHDCLCNLADPSFQGPWIQAPSLIAICFGSKMGLVSIFNRHMGQSHKRIAVNSNNAKG
ncbi:hypothetical protein QL093DRAFT_2311175 [Fusarium oxysporum]|nr:hypothetical protein QL093DRAFT_2311175 [Fusarium oxysporum]